MGDAGGLGLEANVAGIVTSFDNLLRLRTILGGWLANVKKLEFSF
jgi:hypothetical protein